MRRGEKKRSRGEEREKEIEGRPENTANGQRRPMHREGFGRGGLEVGTFRAVGVDRKERCAVRLKAERPTPQKKAISLQRK